MALIRPQVDLVRGDLIVEAKGMPTLRVPLFSIAAAEESGEVCRRQWVSESKQLRSDDPDSLPPTPPLSDEERSDSGLGREGTSRAPLPQMTALCGTAVASVGVSPTADAWFTAFLNPGLKAGSAGVNSSVPAATSQQQQQQQPCVIPRRDASGPGPVELHRLPSGSARHAHFDGQAGPPLPLRLSNESPFLLVSEESLGALNDWIQGGNETTSSSSLSSSLSSTSPGGAPMPVRAQSFRPNLVVGAAPDDNKGDALEPFWEERIDGFTLSRRDSSTDSQSFSTLGKCRRCLMVAVDQVRVFLLPLIPFRFHSRTRRSPTRGVLYSRAPDGETPPRSREVGRDLLTGVTFLPNFVSSGHGRTHGGAAPDADAAQEGD